MRIGIDARFLSHPQVGGFKTYSAHLLAALPEVDTANSYVYYLDRTPPPGLPRAPNVSYALAPGTLPGVGMTLREQALLAWLAWRDQLDLFHAPALTAPLALRCPLVLTLHDMFWAHPPLAASGRGGKRRLMDSYYRLVPRLAARRSARIITVSHAARADLVRDLGVAPSQVAVTHLGCSPVFRPVPQHEARLALAERLGALGPFVLAIGSADPRKNVGALLQAYAALPAELRERVALVIVWAHPRLASQTAASAERFGVAGRVHFLSGVSDQELALLYAAAEVFAFPSLKEGFGLPLLEAMACGAPVVSGDNSSLPEIAGDGAMLVETGDPTAIAAALAVLLTDSGLREELRARGLRRAASFSWKECARATIAVYEHTIAQG